MDILILILGLAILVVGAEILIRGSVSLGKKLNISLFAIGVVIVAAGTSLPELASSINAVLNNHSDLALGAVVGSNIANLILVMAATTIIVPITNITNNQINQAWINIALGICLIIMSYFYYSFLSPIFSKRHLCLGSNTILNHEDNKFSDKATNIIINPGKKASHQANWR